MLIIDCPVCIDSFTHPFISLHFLYLHFLFLTLAGNFYTRNGELLSHEFLAAVGDTITMELNLSDSNRSKHTLHFFISDTQIPYCFHELPEAVQFAFVLGGEGNAIKFVSLEELSAPTAQAKADEVCLPFTSDVLYAPPEDDVSDSDSYDI